MTQIKVAFHLCFLLLINNLTVAQNWQPLGNSGPSGRVKTMEQFGNKLYVGGSFFNTDNTRDVLAWNGSVWTGAGRVISNTISSLKLYNGNLYAGGSGIFGDTTGLSFLSRFNGLSWDSPTPDFDSNSAHDPSIILTMETYQNELYFAGLFQDVDSLILNNIGRWNDTTIRSVDQGINGEVHAMCVYNGELYAGGSFTSAGNISCSNIAKWNGSSWTPVSTGTNNTVYAMAVYNNELVVAGNFTIAGGTPANRIATWNGTGWNALSLGMDNIIRSLWVHNGMLYAAGDFIQADNTLVNHIAKWNGSAWAELDQGVNNNILSLYNYNNELIAGGEFTQAGGDLINYVSRITLSSDVSDRKQEKYSVYPNPATNDYITLHTDSSLINAMLTIMSITGNNMIELTNLSGQEFNIDIRDLTPGVYFLKITKEDNSSSIRRFIVSTW